MRNILVASDLTINSAHAIDRAIQLADVTQAMLHIFHQAPDFRLPGTKQKDEDSFSNAAKSKITEFVQQNKRSANINYEIHIESKGRMHELIDEHAREIQADLVIMGLTNKSKDTPSFVSTTIERVVRRQSILDKEHKKIRCVSGLCFVDIKQPFVVGTTAF